MRSGADWWYGYYKLLVVSFVLTAVSGCKDGLITELESKPVVGEMNVLYHESMCGQQVRKVYDPEVRVVRVSMDTGKCAVLYLDGIDNRGKLFIYPFGAGEHPACGEIQGLLDKYQAHQKVKDKARALCATR